MKNLETPWDFTHGPPASPAHSQMGSMVSPGATLEGGSQDGHLGEKTSL